MRTKKHWPIESEIEKLIEKLLEKNIKESEKKNPSLSVINNNKQLIIFLGGALSPNNNFIEAFHRIIKTAKQDELLCRENLQRIVDSMPNHVYELCMHLSRLKDFGEIESEEKLKSDAEFKLTSYQMTVHALEEILTVYLLKDDKEQLENFSEFKNLWDQIANRLSPLDNKEQKTVKEINLKMDLVLVKLYCSLLDSASTKAAIHVGNFACKAVPDANTQDIQRLTENEIQNPQENAHTSPSS